MSAPAPFRYAERRPSDRIAPWIVSLWSFQADAAPPADEPYTVWPDGSASIGLARVPGAGAFAICVGPRLTALRPRVAPGIRIWGARLWPDAIRAVLGVEAASLRNHEGAAPASIAAQLAGLDHALPREDDPDRVLAALDGWLGARVASYTAPEPSVRAAVRAIVAARGEAALADIAAAAAMSPRNLQRRFPIATGLTIREYSRVRRLREALAHRLRAPVNNWSRVAAEVGFVDHAHLAREFSSLTGISPSDAVRQLARTAHDDVHP
jgi:AraC-like DNA-binding protein